MTPALLEVADLDAGYGDFQALYALSLQVGAGETIAIIGANGAGKTTLLRAVMGQVRVRGGTISYDGEDLSGVPTHDRVRRGMGLVPEGRRLFPSLSVEENLMIGGYGRRAGPVDDPGGPGRVPDAPTAVEAGVVNAVGW